jgi:hypothetical protein
MKQTPPAKVNEISSATVQGELHEHHMTLSNIPASPTSRRTSTNIAKVIATAYTYQEYHCQRKRSSTLPPGDIKWPTHFKKGTQTHPQVFSRSERRLRDTNFLTYKPRDMRQNVVGAHSAQTRV